MAPKSVLITGCSEGGIGAALAIEFHSQGCRVFATARDVGKMQSLAGLGVETLALDVTSDASIASAAAAVEKATGGTLDYVVNNAGVIELMPFADTPVAGLRRVIDTNLVGALAVTQAVLPLLLRARGVVVFVGSVNEVFCAPYQVAYCASKAAVHAAARSLRVELAPFGVRVVTLMTGSVRTQLFANASSRIPDGSLYRPIADTIENRDFLKNARFVEPDVFARQVVGDLLRPNPARTVWAGGLSTVAWILSWLGWEGMLESSMMKVGGLDRIYQ
ncbi:putative short-chain dehydrogenase/reductase [Hypoxylon sp. FL1284]|nr:putative short-chain dehydrogenase/reductase [Hypoxylon sp. FL1284]